jgi:protein tyrosine phosphatase
MIKYTKNFSREHAEELDPKHYPNTCFISINNPPHILSPHRKEISKGPAQLQKGWMDVLQIEFWDVTRDVLNYTPITEEQAETIAKFIKLYYDKNIFVHCEAGVSRSAAVVTILLELGWKPLPLFLDKANPYVQELLRINFK